VAFTYRPGLCAVLPERMRKGMLGTTSADYHDDQARPDRPTGSSYIKNLDISRAGGIFKDSSKSLCSFLISFRDEV
jgi:hypothetical protein